MSSIPFDAGAPGRAEKQFREAFDRLKRGKPKLLPKGSKVSQNNVAKEAGVDPSALRRKRFPNLVSEIQKWIEANGKATAGISPRQHVLVQRNRNRDLREQIEDLKIQRDDALGKLVDAEARIVYLVLENERLSAHLSLPKVAPIRPAKSGKPTSRER